MELKDLEKELEAEVGPDVAIPLEVEKGIRRATRAKLVIEFHEMKLAAQLNKKIGDTQRAEELFATAKRVLQMIAEIDAMDSESKD